MNPQAIDALLQKIDASAISAGDARTKQVVNRIVRDLFITIDELDVTPNEFWSALNYLGEAGQHFPMDLINRAAANRIMGMIFHQQLPGILQVFLWIRVFFLHGKCGKRLGILF